MDKFETAIKRLIEERTEEEIARYIFQQVTRVATRRKSSQRAAADFMAMSYDEKIDYMNTVIFPAWKNAGEPAPETEELMEFTSNLFLDR